MYLNCKYRINLLGMTLFLLYLSVNSCLVNRFEGSESYLPQHSDNEPTIHPESNIITLSLGSECTLTFSNKGSENSVLQHLSSSRSIYSMTRKSQEIYDHRIDQG